MFKELYKIVWDEVVREDKEGLGKLWVNESDDNDLEMETASTTSQTNSY